MFTTKRESEILQAVRLQGACRISELASRFNVSEETIRRSLKPLVSRGLVSKVHGGVVSPDRLQEPPFQRRMLENRDAKMRIASALARQIKDGDSLMFDTGSTTAYVARALADHSNLVIVTNSVEIARTLATRNGNRVYMTGGELRADDGAAFGPASLEFVRRFHVNYAILSIGAVNDCGAFMNFHLCEGEFSRAVIDQADAIIVVADHSKFGKRAPVKVCDAQEVDMLVTDGKLSRHFATTFRQSDVRVVSA
jgi:DeoR family glycerol-3-phosphate regulon repressor